MSRTLQQVINWGLNKVNYIPLTVDAGEPAIGDANNVKQLFLSAGLAWAFNRASTTFKTIIGQTDYTVNALTDFNVLEIATFQKCGTITNVAGSGTVATITAVNQFKVGETVTISGLTHTAFNGTFTITTASAANFTFASASSQASTADAGLALAGRIQQFKEVYNNKPLGESTEIQEPFSISVMTIDTSSNVMFRIMGAPDKNYQVILWYQKNAVPITSVSSNFDPIPDTYAYIYNRLLLGEFLENVDPQRAQAEKQRGIMALVSAAEGLELADKAIFMAQYLNIDAQTAANMIDTQQGTGAKAQR